MASKICQSALNFMPLERNAKLIDREKLTMKFTKPMSPMPNMDIKMLCQERLNECPYKPRAKLPAAKVMCRISRFSPSIIPMVPVKPKKKPNQILLVMPPILFS